ncbi:hypothetical protein ACFFQF_15215 [Haladaptatus pallidirubidus]|uniref:Uncharacterized protein n=1 Tax=Haladaptatus pallidirubidus TaxID=1008152 RepID=A0AAV3UC17_9EURY|nr:hypothetical protein [Haladaptatus pallidirubidus]
MYRQIHHRVNQPFQVGAGGRIGQYVDSFILALIVANVATVILETVEPLHSAYGAEFYLFELVSVVIGIGLFALLASILASGFVEESQHETKYACPHCGERVSEHELHELK